MQQESVKDLKAMASDLHRKKVERHAGGGKVDLGGPALGDMLLFARRLGGPELADLATMPVDAFGDTAKPKRD
jgi:hypothetical protein